MGYESRGLRALRQSTALLCVISDESEVNCELFMLVKLSLMSVNYTVIAVHTTE